MNRTIYYRKGRVVYRAGSTRPVRVATANTRVGAALAVRALNHGTADYRKFLHLSA